MTTPDLRAAAQAALTAYEGRFRLDDNSAGPIDYEMKELAAALAASSAVAAEDARPELTLPGFAEICLDARGWFEGNPEGALCEIEYRARAILSHADAVDAEPTQREAFERAAYKHVADWQGDQHANGDYFFPREQEHWAMWQAAIAAPHPAPAVAEPIDMVLFCPACGMQHIDAPEFEEYMPRNYRFKDGWTNPPHRSHLCHGCGHIWRPADVPTNGVAAVKTTGKADSPIAKPAVAAEAGQGERDAIDLTLNEEETSFLRAFMGEDEGEAPSAIRLQVGAGHDGYGLYVSLAYYPEEGASLLKPIAPPATQPAPPSQGLIEALREFADEADATAQMVVRTFGDRTRPPKMLDAFATVTMCQKLSEQYAKLPAALTQPPAEGGA